MASTPFGEHLKRERQMRGVSLEEISAATRISTRFLEALENGQWDQLPGGAFNRGFIRSTAHFLGLNEDSMVAEYALETKDQNDSRAAVAANMAMPRDWRPLGITVGLLFLMIVGIAYGYHRYHMIRLRRRAAAMAAAASTPPGTPPTADNSASAGATPPSADTPGTPASAASGTSGASISLGSSSSPASTSASALSSSSSKAAPAPTIAAAATDDSKVPAKAPASAATAKDAPKASSVAAVETPAVLRLTIEVGKGEKVKVLADGKKQFDGRLRAKSPRAFVAKDAFEVTAKELASLSLELNGQTVAAPFGVSGKPFMITRKDLKPGGGSGH